MVAAAAAAASGGGNGEHLNSNDGGDGEDLAKRRSLNALQEFVFAQGASC